MLLSLNLDDGDVQDDGGQRAGSEVDEFAGGVDDGGGRGRVPILK